MRYSHATALLILHRLKGYSQSVKPGPELLWCLEEGGMNLTHYNRRCLRRALCTGLPNPLVLGSDESDSTMTAQDIAQLAWPAPTDHC